MCKFGVHAMANPFFGSAIAWALKRFFPEGIELRALSPNFDIHIENNMLTSSRGRRAVRAIVFIFLNKTMDPYEANDTLHETLRQF
jgi:hypothetical protein